MITLHSSASANHSLNHSDVRIFAYSVADMLKHLKEMNIAATINPIDPYYDIQSSRRQCVFAFK